ncbi:MAG: hypothetical protein E7332_02305 [Clostridiales bacterium]|nr:hypothetical protein [Clostridiales bacterium]
MELFAEELHFIGKNEKDKRTDLCIHGKVICRVKGHSLSDDTEWCVSASAYRFLESLFYDHPAGMEEHLIPCCGHMMIPSEDGCSVKIIGCTNGIDFDILHEGEMIRLRAEASGDILIPYQEYKKSVLSFAAQVIAFYRKNPPRRFEGAYEREAFCAYIAGFFSLYHRACSSSVISFADYEAYTDASILGICKNGIALEHFDFIDFAACCRNTDKIIGEYNDDDLSITFYTTPEPIMIRFLPKNIWEEHIAVDRPRERFRSLLRKIKDFGYSLKKE